MSVIGTPAQPHLLDERTGRGSRLSCRLESLPYLPGWPVTVLSVVGELDACTQLLAENALGAAVDTAPGPLVVDLAGLSFCSAYGLELFAGPTGTAEGHAYVLAGMTPHLQRATALLWPAGHPVRYPGIAVAVTAVRADRTPAPAGSRTGSP